MWLAEAILSFKTNFQALIVENFGILAYFLAFQVLIADNFGTFCRKMKVNLTRIWTQYLLQSAQDSTALPELWNFEVLNIKQQ